ncbi:hypothetical protein C482_13575 [Natrialba chahannaoensis JCM 10990]|uniref:Uncharacterized protein n=1 Tax=Natrialba chahannaoensis JCM 10990 TaxID=1227492 RepID=M0AH82_9EURY|nr:hypothetical protein [Natrialba chahannaoensis]ELY97267.1 hypothetical protein C482_13575 [Natrialba chahannaoensis JCM 10990]
MSELLVASHLGVAALAVAGTRSRRSLDEVLETRVGRWLVAAFEPPEPPARSGEQEESSESSEKPP